MPAKTIRIGSQRKFEGLTIGNNFQLQKELPSGGMGRIFKAYQISVGRDVCVKILREDLLTRQESKQWLNYFRNEVRFPRSHPNIVQVYDCGEWEGVHWIAMEWMSQGTVADRIKARPYVTLDALKILLDVTKALERIADKRCFAHRDIKPSNIFISTDGAKLGDFGISKLMPKARHAQKGIAPVGSLPYMSPEQFKGQTDLRSDFYALGCTLFEMLSGKVAFPNCRTPDQAYRAHLENSAPSLPPHLHCPSGVSQFYHQLVEKDPLRRPQTYHEVRKTLSRLIRELRSADKGLQSHSSDYATSSTMLAHPSKRQTLEDSLRRDYPSTRFSIATSQEQFYTLIGDELVS
ncbi:MAG TPA: serine/threonine-protein kinase, partial [Clostridia bacterium]|nr:serine/threonine-protein kinase [Clostridia bacterium]